MGQVTVIIDKREYAITCEDGQEAHIMKLSRILDERAKMISASAGLINENMKLALVGLTLADELQESLQQSGGHTAEDDIAKADNSLAMSLDAQTAKLISLIKDIKAV